MRIMILGDLHAHWAALNNLIRWQAPELVLCCGDLTYWPEPAGNAHDPAWKILNRGVETPLGEEIDCDVRWVDGNHDDQIVLRRLRAAGGGQPVEVAEGVYWQPRGTTFTLADGRVALFVGGARTPAHLAGDGPQQPDLEILMREDLEDLPDGPVDIVVTHTCPARFISGLGMGRLEGDPTCGLLDEVFERYKPKRWYFGHFHLAVQGETDGCKWTALNHVARPNGWAWLED